MRSNLEGARFTNCVAHQPKFTIGSHIANATLTLTNGHPAVMVVDPVGTDGRKVLMPLAADTNKGEMRFIINSADAAESIAVKDSTDVTTFATVAQNEAVIMVSNGTVWYPLVGANT